jgi:hypothetical protein
MERLWRASLRACGALIMLGGFASLYGVGCEGGGVGDPCVPEDEYRENFPGFDLTEANIESRSFQCQTRVCLVNHFQGRVSCRLGQAAPTNCADAGTSCAAGESCVPGGVIIRDCDPTGCDEPGADQFNCNNSANQNPACDGLICNEAGRFCHCQDGLCPAGYLCDAATNLCTTKVCTPDEPTDTRCYIPGTTDPVAVSVCSQCSNRADDKAVYCSCRCGPPSENAPEADDNYNFCDCPEGFTCEEIRRNVGLGDAQLTGKFCVKDGTQYTDESICGDVFGFWAPQCAGTPPPTTPAP